MSFMKRMLLICVAATMFVLAPPPDTASEAEAQGRRGRNRYWNNYWGWYDRSYRPYYNRRYRYDYGYRGYPRYYSYPNYGYGYRYGYPYYGGYYGYYPYQVQIGPLGIGWR